MGLARDFNLSKRIKITFLGAIAFLVMNFDFPLPIFVGFLKFDFSDLIALFGGFAFGPVAVVVIEGIKNLLHLFKTSTGGIGELSNFVVGVVYCLPPAIIYHKTKIKYKAVWGLVIGTVLLPIIASLTNYYIMIPAYSKFVPVEVIVNMCSAINPNITGIDGYIYYMVIPFNFLKALTLSIIALLLHKKISFLLNEKLL